MSLSAGTRLGPYEILEKIGAGGMGEVYRATDTRLHREVAVKVSAERFSDRFEREARAVAALNHPSICTLHDVGPNYLVMELVEGKTLAERIQLGPIPLEQALAIARQIADALEAAHEKGIVHRDLKPGNIKIKPDGSVKVLDFGLAKMPELAPAPGSDPVNSPTLTMEAATRVGAIMGTAGYMAPEQARGKNVDKRADIFAFGVVLYEMLQGRRLFQGETVSDTLAAVLKEEPKLEQVPAKVRPLLQRCLEKDPKKRLRDIGDAWLLLDAGQSPVLPATPHGLLPRRWPGVAAGALALIAAALAFLHFSEQPPPDPEPVVFQIAPPGNTAVVALAVSPDGRQVAFAARGAGGRNRLWVRSLGAPEARALGTDDVAPEMFWSPNSRFIGYSTVGVAGKLKRIDVSGGPGQAICDISGPLAGATWSAADVIIFGSRSRSRFGSSPGLMRVSANGGTPSLLTKLDMLARFDDYHGAPTFLPDGHHFLYRRSSSIADRSGIYLGSLDLKPEEQNSQRLLAGDSRALYSGLVPGNTGVGHILFSKNGILSAQPFDAVGRKLKGDVIRLDVPDGVGDLHSVSASGVLVYVTEDVAARNSRLVWYDRWGKQLGEIGTPAENGSVGLSADGKRAVVNRRANAITHVWVADLSRAVFSRLNQGENGETGPVISTDGRVAFSSTMSGAVGDIYARAVNGLGEPELWVKSSLVMHPNSFSPDGRFLIYDVHDPQRRQDLWILPTTADRKPIPFLTTPADETFGQFSPDGRWIAYSSDESGRREVYVQGFAPDRVPASAVGKWLISAAGGDKPRWRRDGKELFYLALDGKMMAVPVKVGPPFEPGVGIPLFEIHTVGFSPYDVSPEGRFLLNTPIESDASSTPITVVVNWRAALKK